MNLEKFLTARNLRLIGASAAVVVVITLILSQGNFIAAIGAGIGTAASSYFITRRLYAKLKFLGEKLELLEDELIFFQEELKFSEEQVNFLEGKLGSE